MDVKLELKIGDFGLVAQLNVETERKKLHVGNPGEKGYSFEVDIWVIGIIMYYLLTKEFPFSSINKEKIPEACKRFN